MLRNIFCRRAALQIAMLSLVMANALAEPWSDVSFSTGFKLWNQDFKVKQNLNGQATSSSDNAYSPMLSIAVKYNNYFASLGHLFKTRYDLDQTILNSQDRSETDFGVGWYFIPQVALTLGYKIINADLLPSSSLDGCTVKAKVPLVGLSGTHSISPVIFGYASGAISFGTSSSDHCGLGGSSVFEDFKYYTAELGLGYRFENNIQVTAGYRMQDAKYNVKVAGLVNGDTHLTGRGFLMGISYAF